MTGSFLVEVLFCCPAILNILIVEKIMSEEVDDSAFCPVCLERYSETGDAVPRLLPCTHTMCHACVERLLKNNILVCPQDRKSHPAPSGVTSFPQNKYVLKLLRQNKTTTVPPVDDLFYVCEEHGMEVVLYCKHPDCQIGICPLCMTAGHKGHSVVSIAEEQNSILELRVAHLIKRLHVNKNRLIATRQKLNQHRLELVQSLKEKQNELEQEFDEKIKSVDENLDKFNQLSQELKGDLKKEKGFIDTIWKQSEDKEQMKYKFYDLTESTRDMEPPRETDVKQPTLEGKIHYQSVKDHSGISYCCMCVIIKIQVALATNILVVTCQGYDK